MSRVVRVKAHTRRLRGGRRAAVKKHARGHVNRAMEVSPKDRKKLLMAIYKRMPEGNKHLRGGVHSIMFSGPSAERYGVENYHVVGLESLSNADLLRAAIAVGVIKG